ncbi:hypothetical protein CBR_g3024 [Chara braunii]|uniref:Uncharacterized protein n=1 Tax=Chara braunii TaxID=69332 RepID=A0A388KEK0_CHABU|nr:hypothetical protein CBR_g3024 [Chara braunii]|eukprot:GBG68479.1 hypothetical protein CBR_g3024 [Chara braunii]
MAAAAGGLAVFGTKSAVVVPTSTADRPLKLQQQCQSRFSESQRQTLDCSARLQLSLRSTIWACRRHRCHCRGNGRWQVRQLSVVQVCRKVDTAAAGKPRLINCAQAGNGQDEQDPHSGERPDGLKGGDGWQVVAGNPQSSIKDFTRFVDNGDEGAALQTAIVRYRKERSWWELLGTPLTVDLVSVVHIADKQYFKGLQGALADYDRVLYEMVANENDLMYKRPLRDRGSGKMLAKWNPRQKTEEIRIGSRKLNIVSIIQRLMARTLILDFQLENMDYSKENWFHADLTWQRFCRMQKERGESLFSFARKLTVRSTMALLRLDPSSSGASASLPMWQQWLFRFSRIVPMPLLALLMIEGVCCPAESRLYESPEVKALLGLDLATALKVFLAKQLTNDLFDNASDVLNGSVIIGARNVAALEQLDLAITDGCRSVAIFYGSGHLPDIDMRLRTEYGLKPVGVTWRTAWDIPGAAKKVNPIKFLTFASDELAQAVGWPLNRFQTFGLILLSLTLALDLCFWEAIIKGMDKALAHLLLTLAG